ncbi:hypothetical protein CQA44_08395 [Helicobacter sp. MIT 14-3879]|nr:hypothetical protein CQA44_08395 [Helicobacter sp. MIT 14-3879]
MLNIAKPNNENFLLVLFFKYMYIDKQIPLNINILLNVMKNPPGFSIIKRRLSKFEIKLDVIMVINKNIAKKKNIKEKVISIFCLVITNS